jgi:cytochrome c oxidase assembly protein subunit 15
VIIPPLSSNEWELEFDRYKQSPEFIKINSHMTIEEFKKIYYIEFIHRIAGRITGLLYIIPLVFFYYQKKIPKENNILYLSITFLFATQGFMGWYMVSSGLVSNPYVSHFRLALHLIIACVIYNLILLLYIRNKWNMGQRWINQSEKSYNKILPSICIILLYLQIFLGGLTAGLDAGLVYNTFPLMGGNIIPAEVIGINIFDIKNFYDPVFVQLMHRGFAVILFCFCFGLAIYLYSLSVKDYAIYILMAIIGQFLLGVFTLVYSVPIYLGLLHQLFAIVLLTIIFKVYYFLLKS